MGFRETERHSDEEGRVTSSCEDGAVVYRKTVLPNGLRIVAEQHPHVRSVSIGVWVRVGSALEGTAQNGVSHFIEHMLFKGTETRTPLEIATVLESLGGDLNAFTDREFTCFHATVLREHVEVAFDVVSDLLLRPTFPKDQLERERKVLLQELSMVEDAPDDWISDVFLGAIWKGEAMGQPVIGNKKTIRTLSRAQLLRYFKTHYRPDNIVVSVAGNVAFEQIKALVEKYFAFPAATKPMPRRPKAPRYHSVHKAVTINAEQAHVLVGFEGVGFQHPYRFDALILSFFLGGGMSSRLFQEVREKAGLAYSVECDCVPFTETGVFTIYAALSPRSLRQCLNIIGREVRRLKEEPLTEREISLVKGQLKGTILLCSDQMETRQESLGRNELVFGRYVSVEEVVAEIDRVSPDRILKLANELFRPEKEAIVTLSRSPLSRGRLTVL